MSKLHGNYSCVDIQLNYEQLMELLDGKDLSFNNCNFFVVDNHPEFLANEFIADRGNLRNCYIKYACKRGDGAAWKVTEVYNDGDGKMGVEVVNDPNRDPSK